MSVALFATKFIHYLILADGNWYPVETESKLKFYINIRNGEICNQIGEDENLTYYLTPNEISVCIIIKYSHLNKTIRNFLLQEIIRKMNESNNKKEQTKIDELHYKQNENAIIKVWKPFLTNVKKFRRIWVCFPRYRCNHSFECGAIELVTGNVWHI